MTELHEREKMREAFRLDALEAWEDYLATGHHASMAEVLLARAHLEREIKDKDGKEKPVDRKASYEDIIWALFNTKEFLFNH